jgi:S-formylglutathione hydrolase
MYSYVTKELRGIAEENLPIDSKRQSIAGHSMGGHGALVLGLKNPELYRSISAFAPICSTIKSPWGQKAFNAYLGANPKLWQEYDAEALVSKAKTRTPILIDQGLEDEFLKTELFVDDFEKTLRNCDYPAQVRKHAGYDHSYFFISTFIEEHLAFHAKHLH